MGERLRIEPLHKVGKYTAFEIRKTDRIGLRYGLYERTIGAESGSEERGVFDQERRMYLESGRADMWANEDSSCCCIEVSRRERRE